ncbi:MAG TPA: acyl-CoA dehydrogenase family protein [Chloroflexota bacterium]|nr:acyl-CoA dehydrogenase family protein [Chloroflexota bacterium]
MDFALSEDEELFRGAVSEFAAAVLAPAAAAADEAGRFAPEVLAQTAALGLFGMLVPEAQGGAGVGAMRFAIALEEIARASAAMAALLNAHNALGALSLVLTGTAVQQARWLPALARGEALGAGWLASAEAAGGASGPEVRAAPTADGWQLDGAARWVTNGGEAALYVVFAAVEGAGGTEQGATGLEAFVVPADAPGVRAGAPIEKVGLRGAVTADLALAGCRLPEDARLGVGEGAGESEGGGPLAERVHALWLIGSAAQALGIARASLDAAVAYAQERQQFGQPIARFEGLRHLLADVALAVEAARPLVYRAAWMYARGQPVGSAAAMAKLHAGETAMLAATKAVQVYGGYGYMREAAVQRYFRDAKVTQAAAGNALQQRGAIADALLE